MREKKGTVIRIRIQTPKANDQEKEEIIESIEMQDKQNTNDSYPLLTDF